MKIINKRYHINKSKTLAIIGGRGMLGSDLAKYFSPKFKVTIIDKDNYRTYIGNFFDIVINANGNSKRFWANQNPQKDFQMSTVSVMNSIFNFSTNFYIYISSVDVYENHSGVKYTNEGVKISPERLSAYGLHKYLSELIVRKYCKNFLILRPSMILGSKLKKGSIYDIVNSKPLFVTLKSRYQMITTHGIFLIIKKFLEISLMNEIVNIGGSGSFNFIKAERLFNKKIQLSDEAVTQIYEMNVEKLKHLYPSLKTSGEYLQEFMRDYLKN
jgi:dTDP-4-dehydrorhamnose reductase